MLKEPLIARTHMLETTGTPLPGGVFVLTKTIVAAGMLGVRATHPKTKTARNTPQPPAFAGGASHSPSSRAARVDSCRLPSRRAATSSAL